MKKQIIKHINSTLNRNFSNVIVDTPKTEDNTVKETEEITEKENKKKK